MAHFQAVRSGITISQSIADMLERADPKQYNGANHAQTILEVNDILQGRSELSFDMLYSILKQKCGEDMGRVEKIKRDVEAFHAQKSSRSERYTLTGTQEYHYETWDYDPQRPLKIISQPLFDHAAEHGFPPDFFTASFSIIKAVGVIVLGWGIVQVGMSIQSHDASQRTQGFLCLFGGLMIAFAKEILTTIGAL